MIKKIAQEKSSGRTLVVSRLSRLVGIVKAAVEEKRDDGSENITYLTYEDLLQLLARRVVPDDDSDYQSFVLFDKVYYDCDDESGISFNKKFVDCYLSDKERKRMSDALVEPLTLWFAIITIKSHASCVATKMSLTRDEYLALPVSFGLSENQRHLCYDMFTVYQEWCDKFSYWDEASRALYVLTYGPSAYRDANFVPWTHRVNSGGEYDLLDEDGAPQFPFFFDKICADEAQVRT